MISYCVAAFRPAYVRPLVDELVGKTSVEYEVLLWLNVVDAGLEAFLAEQASQGLPVRVVGKTPENIGMRAYRELFRAARYPLLVQIDDDVVRVSPGIAERAARLFAAFPGVRQIVADVWQDEYTTGARPPLTHYRCVDEREGLYDGPIDGWFSIYHRSILTVLLALPYREYFALGGTVRQQLQRRGLRGLLCTRMKVFHVIGPHYASLFGMLDAEVEKYRRLGRLDIVDWYLGERPMLPSSQLIEERFAAAAGRIDGGSWGVSRMAALEDPAVVAAIKNRFAPDGGAEREHNAGPESLGFGLIHYGLVTNLKPRRALAIGSRFGFVPSIIALALQANGSGVLDFVDANYDDAVHGFATAYGGVGHWRDEATTGFASSGLGDIVRVHVMTSAQFFASSQEKYGYVYLDGNHGDESCRFDFEQAVRVAEEGAMIALHDVLVTEAGFGVGRLVDSLPPDHFDRLLIPVWPGLAIVQPRRTAQP